MSAIQKKDVQQNDLETQTGVEASPNPRNDRMEEIAEANAKRMQEELAEAGLVDAAAANEEVENPLPAVGSHLITEEELANFKVKTKVNGVEEELPVADVVRGFQKDSAASRKLEQVATRQRDLEAREKELEAREKALSNTVQAQPSNKDADIDEVVTAIYEGDENKTKAALTKLVGREVATQPAEVNVGDIVTEVKEQLAYQQEMDKFGTDFADVVHDPFLASVADTYLEQELKDGVPMGEALTNAGNATRAWLKEKSTTYAAPADDGSKRDEKLARKEDLDNVTGANTKQVTTNQQVEESPSDVIAAMRIARGLPA